MNLKYKINGYKIGRKDGKIILWPDKNINIKSTSNKITIDDLKEIKEINDIFDRLNNITERLTLLEQLLNSTSVSNQTPQDNTNKKINCQTLPKYAIINS